jgi:hypothetical protein
MTLCIMARESKNITSRKETINASSVTMICQLQLQSYIRCSQ